ncbi:hypothetical protein E7Z59_02715 [Robertkochia marina]|uniref:Uncharacterized protein n=1 Tax=Robertkochia marina TaxID=1227945 RepID=A0A4S3M4L8_9FLAO|nr:hypothetical protein [Robertkochia marina]THD69261.1 hypothetical protein E7Z59_02715 [Robertkochia marina]TRZ47481.1 hypothetical protein D3A96_01885 [Robertkochia marina]
MKDYENLKDLHLNFIRLLEQLYGTFNQEKNKFESTSNSKIARDLFYSDSQFSRLINGTASEGEFKRAVRNVERSLELIGLKEKEGIAPGTSYKPQKNKKGLSLVLSVVAVILASSTIYFGLSHFSNPQKLEDQPTVQVSSRFDMLKWSFENHYINPYVKLRELPEDCYYPCYKYQGKWNLKEEYKIPFFRERNGFHYVAKEATMYTNCLENDSNTNGEAFEGYEYQKHEIWYDTRELPIDSFLVTAGSTKIRPEYTHARFEEDDHFVKIAYVHTFFRGEYTLDSASVYRSGKVIGRDLEFIADETLLSRLDSEKLVEDIKSEVNAIAQNRLEDFSKPISCDPAQLPKEDFHMLDEGDALEFNCQFSTGRFLVDYHKEYVLDYQYINNVCR